MSDDRLSKAVEILDHHIIHRNVDILTPREILELVADALRGEL